MSGLCLNAGARAERAVPSPVAQAPVGLGHRDNGPAPAQDVGLLAVPAATKSVSITDALDRLEMIRDLPDDWNGNGDPTSIPAGLVQAVAGLIRALPLVPLPVPSTLGGIALQFEDGRLGYLELLVLEDFSVQICSASPSGEQDVSYFTDFEKIPDVVKEFALRGLWKRP